MTSFGLKQIGLALCLLASLLFGSVSACTCSHQEETADSSHDTDHASHGGLIENDEDIFPSASSDGENGCVANVRAQPVLSKSDIKELKADDSVSSFSQVMPDPEFIAATMVQLRPPEFDRNLSYSNALESLLPSRAPPRL